MKLKRARLADDLNEKIALRPGPLELVEKNIIPVDSAVKEAIKGSGSERTWCGAVRCGMVWCGAVRCGVVWCRHMTRGRACPGYEDKLCQEVTSLDFRAAFVA